MTARVKANRPKGPQGKYKLEAAANGQFCKRKTINGKRKAFYLGKWGTRGDLRAAEAKWDAILLEAANPQPAPQADRIQIVDLVDRFWDAKQKRVQDGELVKSSAIRYESLCHLIVDTLGESTVVVDLVPSDFEQLYYALKGSYLKDDVSPTTLLRDVKQLRHVFNWGARNLTFRLPNWGDALDGPSTRQLELAKEARIEECGEKFFTREEIHKLLQFADDPQLKAFVLIGLNAGYGTDDAQELRRRNIDGQWLRMRRRKTGKLRRCWLWEETLEALEALPGTDYVFARFSMGYAFKELRKTAGVYRPFRSQYTLRSTLVTIGEEVDRDAVRWITGHSEDRSDTGSHYRTDVRLDRYKRVSQHVHDWLHYVD